MREANEWQEIDDFIGKFPLNGATLELCGRDEEESGG